MASPTVSVIVPVYNKAASIARCLDSLLAQTYDDFEVLCVDDCSTDESRDIIERYALNDDRIKVLPHDRNQGVGAARNSGLDHAQGRYVTFLDADDMLHPTALEKTCGKGIATNADAVVYDLEFYQEGRAYTNAGPVSLFMSYLPADHSDPFACNEIGDKAFLFTGASVCTKLFSRTLIENLGLRFTEHRIAEDLVFTYTFLANAARITTIEEALYRYDLGTGSGNGVNTADMDILLDAFTVLANRLNANGLLSVYRNAFMNLAFGHFDNMFQAAPDAASLHDVFNAVSDWLRTNDDLLSPAEGITFVDDNYVHAFEAIMDNDFVSYLAFRYDVARKALEAERNLTESLRHQLTDMDPTIDAITNVAGSAAPHSSKMGNLITQVSSKAKRMIKKS